MSALVFLDTETTGLHVDRRPWEIAIIRREEDTPDRRHLVQVKDVDLSNAELMGLNVGGFYERHCEFAIGPADEDRGYRPLAEFDAAVLVEALTRGAHIVGAVPNFDTECLAAMLRRHRLTPSWHYHLIDVEVLAVGWLHAQTGDDADRLAHVATPPYKSDELSLACGVQPPTKNDRHTAMGDAVWAMRWYDTITGGAS